MKCVILLACVVAVSLASPPRAAHFNDPRPAHFNSRAISIAETLFDIHTAAKKTNDDDLEAIIEEVIQAILDYIRDNDIPEEEVEEIVQQLARIVEAILKYIDDNNITEEEIVSALREVIQVIEDLNLTDEEIQEILDLLASLTDEEIDEIIEEIGKIIGEMGGRKAPAYFHMMALEKMATYF